MKAAARAGLASPLELASEAPADAASAPPRTITKMRGAAGGARSAATYGQVDGIVKRGSNHDRPLPPAGWWLQSLPVDQPPPSGTRAAGCSAGRTCPPAVPARQAQATPFGLKAVGGRSVRFSPSFHWGPVRRIKAGHVSVTASPALTRSVRSASDPARGQRPPTDAASAGPKFAVDCLDGSLAETA